MSRKKDHQADPIKMQMGELYKSGMGMKEIAQQFGVSHQRVSQCLTQIGLDRKDRGHWASQSRNDARRKEAVAMLRTGMTSQEIANRFGVSNTVIWKYVSELKENEAEYASVMDDAEKAKFLMKTGVDVGAFPSIDEAKKAWGAFIAQRGQAGHRGIEWDMTFAEWWSVWCESGHWSERGRSHAQSFVMGRFSDSGPYRVGNVHVISFSQNISDSWKYFADRMDYLDSIRVAKSL